MIDRRKIAELRPQRKKKILLWRSTETIQPSSSMIINNLEGHKSRGYVRVLSVFQTSWEALFTGTHDVLQTEINRPREINPSEPRKAPRIFWILRHKPMCALTAFSKELLDLDPINP